MVDTIRKYSTAYFAQPFIKAHCIEDYVSPRWILGVFFLRRKVMVAETTFWKRDGWKNISKKINQKYHNDFNKLRIANFYNEFHLINLTWCFEDSVKTLFISISCCLVFCPKTGSRPKNSSQCLFFILFFNLNLFKNFCFYWFLSSLIPNYIIIYHWFPKNWDSAFVSDLSSLKM